MTKLGEIFTKIFTNLILVVLSIAVVFMSYSFVCVNLLKKSYVNYFGYTAFEVASGSMANTINIDDLVIIKLGNTNLKEKDIITYISEKDFITHRIVSVEGESIIAKGDANNTEDNNIQRKDVIGKVVKVIPGAGVWKKVIMTPKVLILLFVTLVLFNFAFAYKKKGNDDCKVKDAKNIGNLNEQKEENKKKKIKKKKPKKEKIKEPFRK